MKKTILLIEDNIDIRENTAEILELANYNVSTAKDGKEGVQLAQKLLPELIICDIMMPELDGYGVLHILSRDENTKNIPFVFLTAKVDNADFRKGMNLGADDYLTKPFDETDLLDAVECRLKRVSSFQGQIKTPQYNSLTELISNSKVKTYKKKETMFQEGDYPNYLYYVDTGKVKVYLLNDDGKELIIGLYGPGDFIGYTALLENHNHKEIASVLEEATIKLIPRYDFLELINSQNNIVKEVLSLVTNDIEIKEEQLINLAYDTVRKRVAQALLQLLDKYKEENNDFAMRISRQDLASMAATATESVIRIISELKESKIIRVEGSLITILNEAELRKIMY